MGGGREVGNGGVKGVDNDGKTDVRMKAENDKKGRKEETEQEEKDFPPLPLYKKKK